MIDPRPYKIMKSFGSIRRILSIVSGKGGVGKTTVASILSLALSDLGFYVGLLDLDFFGPSCHVVFGLKNFGYKEEKGIVPYSIADNLEFVSVQPFIKESFVSFRGTDMSNAVLEFLSIINWGKIEILVIDMPPGMGDTFLEILRIIKNLEHIVVSTNSKLSIETVSRLIKYLRSKKYRIVGLIENMANQQKLKDFATKNNIRYMGAIPLDPRYEENIGNPKILRKTSVYKTLHTIARLITNQ